MTPDELVEQRKPFVLKVRQDYHLRDHRSD